MSKTISVPPSKSISNRVLVMGILNNGEKVIRNLLKSDDTKVMLDIYKDLGVEHEILDEDARSLDIWVKGGINIHEAELFMENSGTATRFTLPTLCLCSGSFHMKGSKRMLERPIGDLVDALRQLGAKIEYLGNEGYLPLHVIGQEVLEGKCIIKGDVSSQYFSGLLIANMFGGDFEVELEGELVSKPYVDLTRSVIEKFKLADEYIVEGDASSASYWWGLGFLTGEEYIVENVPVSTKQADIQFLDALKHIPGKIDCTEFPDSAMTLAILCAVTPGESKLTGLGNLKFKECDRLKALSTELKKVGCKARALQDGLKIAGIDRSKLKPAKIKTYKDHRIAMCFALLKYLEPEIEILDPQCVSKTYPTFWEEFPVEQ